jgi:hypothetical protein
MVVPELLAMLNPFLVVFATKKGIKVLPPEGATPIVGVDVVAVLEVFCVVDILI